MLGHLGFSYVGLIYLLMLWIPNSIWSKNKPVDYNSTHENKILLLLERVGQVCCTASILIFNDFNIAPFSAWSLWFIASFLLMILWRYGGLDTLLINILRKIFIVVFVVFLVRVRVCLLLLFCYWVFTERLFG
jgi:hypothetical protein